MKLIFTIILGNIWILFCSSLSVGFKATNFKDKEAILIIGEISHRASSVQYNDILIQLNVFKDLYATLKDRTNVEINVGKLLKAAPRIASLFEADCEEFIAFLQERSSQNLVTNCGIHSFLQIYSKPSFYFKSANNKLPGKLHLSLGETVFVDLFEMFPESMEVGDHVDEYDDGKSDLERHLLLKRTRSNEKRRICDCCNIC